MGTGVAINFLNIGIPVTLLETSFAQCDISSAKVRQAYEMSSAFKTGKLTNEAVDKRMKLFSTTRDYSDLANLDLVIEAVYENMPVKKQIFGRLDKVCKPGAILASNTSNLSIDELASCTDRPEAVIGLRKKSLIYRTFIVVNILLI